MVGLSALFLTIVYIGAIFLRKKFSSILHGLVGVNGSHSDQMASATGRLAKRMLLDMGLDALPILGPILGHRKREGGGENGLSMKDELKLWWKSRRGGKGGPAGGDIESQPPTRKPDAGEHPGKPESSDFGAVEETGDRPVFIYADRGSAAPDEGVPPESQDEVMKALWNDSGAPPAGGSFALPVGEREMVGSPVEQEAAVIKENGRSSAQQFRASKPSDYYKKEEGGAAPLRPSEAAPNARALSAADRADLFQSGDGQSAGRAGGFVSPTSGAESYRSNQSAVPYSERKAPEHSWAESAAQTSKRGAAVRAAQASEQKRAEIPHFPRQVAAHKAKQESPQRKTISTEEAENASSSRSERLGGKTAESEIPARESGGR